jgi:hypothetical protein
MNAYFVLFINDARFQAQVSGTPSEALEQLDSQDIVETVLDCSPLGKYVGGNWKVDGVMRWISNVVCCSFTVSCGVHVLIITTLSG